MLIGKFNNKLIVKTKLNKPYAISKDTWHNTTGL